MRIFKKLGLGLVVSMLAVSMFSGAVMAGDDDDVVGDDSTYARSATTGATRAGGNYTYSASNYSVKFTVAWFHNGSYFYGHSFSATKVSGWDMHDVNAYGLFTTSGLTDNPYYAYNNGTTQMNAAGMSSFRGGFLNREHQLPFVLFNCNSNTGNTSAQKSGHWVDGNWATEWAKLEADAGRTSGSPQYWT